MTLTIAQIQVIKESNELRAKLLYHSTLAPALTARLQKTGGAEMSGDAITIYRHALTPKLARRAWLARNLWKSVGHE